jgi:hypothetical protein
LSVRITWHLLVFSRAQPRASCLLARGTARFDAADARVERDVTWRRCDAEQAPYQLALNRQIDALPALRGRSHGNSPTTLPRWPTSEAVSRAPIQRRC